MYVRTIRWIVTQIRGHIYTMVCTYVLYVAGSCPPHYLVRPTVRADFSFYKIIKKTNVHATPVLPISSIRAPLLPAFGDETTRGDKPVRYDTIRYDTHIYIRYDTIRCLWNTLPCDTIWYIYDTISIRYDAIRYDIHIRYEMIYIYLYTIRYDLKIR